jgi:hypothetical protein
VIAAVGADIDEHDPEAPPRRDAPGGDLEIIG